MKNGKFTVNDIANSLGVSPQTIKRWVWWYESKVEEGFDFEYPIPAYEKEGQLRLWKADIETIEGFKAFRQNLGENPFAEYNALHHWGRRGKAIASRKSLN